jgi:hypothetical protein
MVAQNASCDASVSSYLAPQQLQSSQKLPEIQFLPVSDIPNCP